MYERLQVKILMIPMRIYPAVHYTMGGLWVDYELMTNVPIYIHWEKRISVIMERMPRRLH
jgi:succinate dehydrogenase/fumarate reductase flavoprotein subunit